jgi:hypothetical protein
MGIPELTKIKYRRMEIMGQKYCPNCKQVVTTKALPNYTQVDYRGVLVKRREIVHLEEDGGCGHIWHTVEVLEDLLFTEDVLST